MEDSRTRKSIKNVFFGFGTQIIVLIINFLSRTIFIRYLGAEMLGISSLYTNILTLLSMAELGFGNAIIYSMYKPIKENDEEKISALLNYYKRIYSNIIIVISAVGCLLIPFLPKIVNADLGINDLIKYYLLFLVNTICSYVFAYKSSIINAQQKIYINKLINLIVIVIQFIVQTAVIIITKNYVLFLIIQILCTLLNNILCTAVANKMYPYIKKKSVLDIEEKNKIKQNVSSIFLYKVSGTILNNTDNIFISLLVSTIAVGYYSNYYMIISALTNIIYIFFNAITASVGNLMTEKDEKKQEAVFMQLNYICFIITGICVLELFGLMSDFIYLWVGKEFILETNIVYIIIINFYIYTMQNTVWAFRDTSGLFKDAKNDTIILTISNIILSYILGKIFGLFGILLATAISRLFITSWHQPYMLYVKIFKKTMKEFACKQIYYILIIAICIIPVILINNIFENISIKTLILKGLLILISTSIIFLLFTFKTKEFKECILKLKNIKH